MRFPTIHLNGTSGEELERQVREAAVAVQAAISKLNEAAPHGRDYYVQDLAGFAGTDAASEAHREHRSRMDRLQSVRDELVKIHEEVAAQLASRRRR